LYSALATVENVNATATEAKKKVIFFHIIPPKMIFRLTGFKIQNKQK
jgi:hypothetical protein